MFLDEMNHARKACMEAGISSFSGEKLRGYEARYDQILEEGEGQHQATKGKIARREERSSMKGLGMYCSIMSVIETVKRRGLNIYHSIAELFEGRSVIA